MIVAIYDVATGRISRRVSCPPDHVDIQVHEGEDFYLNCRPEATHILNDQPTVQPDETSVLLARIRAERDRLLKESDWTQLEDSPVNRQAWKTYRQALRDFPAHCDPYDPAWPSRP